MSSLKRIFVVLFFILLALPSFSQPGSNPGGGTKPGVPISGIEILVAVGGLIGLKKIFHSRKVK